MFWKKISALIIPVVVFIIGAASNLEAKPLPIPADSELVSEEARRIAGSDMEFTYYASSQSQDQIKDFYRDKLLNQGWKEKNFLAELKNIPNFKVDPSLSAVSSSNLMFGKDKQLITITFLPEGVFRDNKTHFSLSQGELDLEAPVSGETSFVAELLAKPKKDVAPVYPRAYLITLSEDKSSLRATYSTNDPIEKVEEFYKDKMPAYGWELTDERPLQRIESSGLEHQEIADLCPACAQSGVKIKPVEMSYAQMDFSNARGDGAVIGLSQVISGEKLEEMPNFTTILVDYAEKKK